MEYLIAILIKVLQVILIVCCCFVITVFYTALNRKPEKTFWQDVYDNWMTFARFLGFLVFTTVFSILYFLIVPWFVLFFMLKDDTLGKKLDGETYWHDPKPVDFSLRRNYKLY